MYLILGCFQITSAVPGTVAAVLDVEAAFRTIPIHPSNWKYNIIRDDADNFYIDKCLPFGVTTAVGIHGETVDAFMRIVEWHGIDATFKWVDDLTFWQVSLKHGGSTMANDTLELRVPLSAILHLAEQIGLPLHKTKRQDFAHCLRYVGFDWDIIGKSVSIPLSKAMKYTAKIDKFLQEYRSSPAPLHAIQSVHGSLMHCTFVVKQGRSRLSATQKFMQVYAGVKYRHLHVPKSMVDELLWWKQELSNNVPLRSLRKKPLDDTFQFYVDASSSFGLGIVIKVGEHEWGWDAWRGTAGWLNSAEGRDIGWAETVGIELVTYAAEELGLSDCAVLVRCDNSGAVGSVRKGVSKNRAANRAIQRLWLTLQSNSLAIEPVYVNTEDNLADGASRGSPILSHSRFRFTFQLPDDLCNLLAHV